MKAIASLFLLVLVAICAWRVASIISPDAVSMAVGMLFGVLAGIPTALLVMASSRRAPGDDEEGYESHRTLVQQQRPQPPYVILIGGNGADTSIAPQVPTVWQDPTKDWKYTPVGDDEPLEW